MAGLGKQPWILPRDSDDRGVWNADLQTQPGDITRGEGHVGLLIESAQANGPWTAAGLPTLRGFDPKGPPPVGPAGQFGGWHAGGANVVYVDEHLQFLSDRVDSHVFAPLCLIARPH
jgi:prepilin-type processing-associated H-X9-DG protein